jgi:hypothetical protein
MDTGIGSAQCFNGPEASDATEYPDQGSADGHRKQAGSLTIALWPNWRLKNFHRSSNSRHLCAPVRRTMASRMAFRGNWVLVTCPALRIAKG